MSAVFQMALLQRQITRQLRHCNAVEQQLVEASAEATRLQRNFNHVTIMLNLQLIAARVELCILRTSLDELCSPIVAIA